MENLINKSKVLRLKVLNDIYRTKKGHIGGTFSCIEMLIYLYYGENGLKIKTNDMIWGDRDRLVVGKGHACLALYNIWSDLNIIDKEKLNKYGENGGYLGGQLNINTPGVEYNSGSLGHAIGIASGMALSAIIDKKKYRIFALIGDGECSEGSIWESLLFASQNKLNNLIGIIDCNRLGVTDIVDYGNEMTSLQKKIESFGWESISIDGHNFEEIEKSLNIKTDKPLMIIANTIKGKGVSFMENGIKWHHSVPTKEEYTIAKKELED